MADGSSRSQNEGAPLSEGLCDEDEQHQHSVMPKKQAKGQGQEKWRRAALTLAYLDAVDITGTPLCRVGDSVPVSHTGSLDETHACQSLDSYVQMCLKALASFLCAEVNSRVPTARRGRQCEPFCEEEVIAILDTTLERINNVSQQPSLSAYFDMETRVGWWKRSDGSSQLVSRHRFYTFRSLLLFEPESLADVLNELFLDDMLIPPGDNSAMFIAGDEAMVPGGFPWSGSVPRKCHPLGIRFYMLAYRLPQTGRPVVLYVLPDFGSPSHVGQVTGAVNTPKQALEKFGDWFVVHRSSLPRHVWITTNALFTSPDLVQVWEANGLHASMALPQDLYPGVAVIGHNLSKGHHRVIDVGGRYLLTVYRDEKLVATASTGFYATSDVSSDPPGQSPEPLLSPAGGACLSLLQAMEPGDLRHIVRLSGAVSIPDTTDLAQHFTRQPHLSFYDVPPEQLLRAAPLIEELNAAYAAARSHVDSMAGGEHGHAPGPSVGTDRRNQPAMPDAPPRKKARLTRDRSMHEQLIVRLRAHGFEYSGRQWVASDIHVKQLAVKLNIDLSSCSDKEERAKCLLEALKALSDDGDGHGHEDEEATEAEPWDAEQSFIGLASLPSSARMSDDTMVQLFGPDWRSSVPSTASLMSSHTTDQLRRKLRRICPTASITGEKAALARKLNQALLLRLRSPKFARMCLTSNSKAGKPETIRFHRDAINAVDVLDLLMSFLVPDDIIKSQHMVVLAWLVRLTVVHGHSLCSSLEWSHTGTEWHHRDKAEYDRQMGHMRDAHESYVEARMQHAMQLRDGRRK